MSFDKDTRNLLAKTVAACRRRLIEDITDQLRGVFGLHPDGTVLPLDKLTHLSPDQNSAARRLHDLLDHYTVGAAGKDSDRRKAAYERMVLEISFTVLNRSAALRLCEERGLVIECVRKGTTSAGFQMFERISGGALGSRFETYRVFLECMFDELALDLGVLFDRMTPQSAVFPSERCMEDVLAELNKPELTHLWTEDETIGWVYQYFNPPEERKAMREASQAPRNSRELAVRNQFFTPRYVVEFLTDNTLGRIWYEMRKGDTALKEECRYLVRRPSEVFLGPGEKAPAEKGDETDLSQEELLKRPVYIEHRPKKDPRDLRILDPASGSGHFLLYAFDLLEHIYEEAWLDMDSPKSEVTGRTLQEDFKTLDDLRREVPKLIVEHNLHGIDIDPRAVQIAALALWLRAQKTWKNLGLKAAARPRIAKSNIVTAEPMPGEEDMRREFTAGLKPRVLGQIVDEVFEKMELAGEAGSLLKIDEEIKDAVAAAGKQWREGPKLEQQFLFPGMDAPRPKQQELRFDMKGITDERFWDQAEDRILDALKEYAERAENGHATRRRLFAEDTARGFAFIDLCRKRYDAVLMNPPFGEACSATTAFLKETFPLSKTNIYACFCERGGLILGDGGLLGAISSRSGFFQSSLTSWREEFVLSQMRPATFADLGAGVLDAATVETACYVLKQASDAPAAVFFDALKATDKSAILLDSINQVAAALLRTGTYIVPLELFSAIPGSPLAYSVSDRVRASFQSTPGPEEVGKRVRIGLSTKCDERFVRVIWEVPLYDVGRQKMWSRYANGGRTQPFYDDYPLVVKSKKEFEELRTYLDAKFPYLNGNLSFILHDENSYDEPAIVWPLRALRFSPHALPRGYVFSARSYAMLFDDQSELMPALALLTSEAVHNFLRLQLGETGRPEYVTSAVRKLPIPDLKPWMEELRCLASRGLSLFRLACAEAETSPIFRAVSKAAGLEELPVLEEAANTLGLSVYGLDSDDIDSCGDSVTSFVDCLSDISEDLDHSPSMWAGFAFGRWDVRYATGERLSPELPDPFDPLPVCPPGMLQNADGLPAESADVPADYPLRITWDGILVDDPGYNGNQSHREDIVRRLREALDLLWKDKAHEIEQEACDILGVSNLRDYFRKPTGFFQDHLKRYSKNRRKAPIYWPLSTPSGSYTIWLYYHRLTDQTLYTAVNKYVEPKISEVERGIGGIENDLKSAAGRDTTRLTDRLSEARTFLSELRDLREELLRIAALPYKPDLNDGVIINASPFHNLFRLRPWAKDTADCWKKLEKGDYDWAHLAYTIWPDRVREVCRADRSIAIAHGLESLCEVEAPGAKKKGGPGRRRKKETS